LETANAFLNAQLDSSRTLLLVHALLAPINATNAMTPLNVSSARTTTSYSLENVDLTVLADMSRATENAYLAKPKTALLAL
jgi:tryptophanase